MSAAPSPLLLTIAGDAFSLAEPIDAIAFAPGKPLVAALGHGGRLRIWNTASRETLRRAFIANNGGSGLLAFLDDAHVLVDEQSSLVRIPVAANEARVPFTIEPDLPRHHAVTGAAATIVFQYELDGRSPDLWRLGIRSGAATPLELWLPARELQALGITPFERPSISFLAAAPGSDGSVLALVSYAELAAPTSEFLYVRWLPAGERIVAVHLSRAAAPPIADRMFHTRGFRWHPSGRWALHAWGDPLLVAIDTGEVVATYDTSPFGPQSIHDAIFVDGGKTLAGVSDEGLALWDTASGALRAARRFGKRVSGTRMAASDAHGTIAVSDDAAVLLHSSKDLAPLHTATGHGNAVQRAAICPRGRRLASTDRHQLKMWHLPSGEPIWSRYATTGNAIAFSPDGTQLACELDGRFHVLDAATGDVVTKAESAGGSFVWTAEGRLVHVDYVDDESRTLLRVFEGPERRPLWETPTVRLACVPAISADGRRVLVSDISCAHGWDIPSRRRLWTRDLEIFGAVLSPDGALAAYSEARVSDVRVLSMEQGRSAGMWPAAHSVPAIAWSAANRVAFTVQANGQIRIVRPLPDEGAFPGLLLDGGHADEVTSLAFSADGSRLVSGARDGSLALWKIP